MKTEKHEKKYFAYMRVSKDDYEASNINQKDLIKKIAKDRDIKIQNIKFLEEKKSWSKDSERKIFSKMTKTLEEDFKKHQLNLAHREYAGVICFKIDRLARNDEDFNTLFNLLDNGYVFISATETIENTPTGRLLFRMLCSFAVYESEKLSNRISIARLHNLLNKKFNQLGGTTEIFWYKKVNKKDEKKRLTITSAQAKIIKEIYEIYYSFQCEWKAHKRAYKEVFNFLSEKSKNYIEDTIKTDKGQRIKKILENDNMVRYDWTITVNINVNDELIQGYLKTICDDEEFNIVWDNEIGGKIKLSFFEEKLAVLPSSFYYDVQKKFHNSQKRYKTRDKDEIPFNWLFEDITFTKWKGQEYKTTVDYKRDKNYYWQKIDIKLDNGNKKTISISEKKLEGLLKKERIEKYVYWIKKEDKEAIIDIVKTIPLHQKEKIKRLIAEKNIYTMWYNRAKKDLNEAKSNKEFCMLSWKARRYGRILDNIKEKFSTEKSSRLEFIQNYMELLLIKDLYSTPIYTRRMFYITFIEKIVFEKFNDNWEEIPLTIRVYFKWFLTGSVWLPKEITITADL